MTEPNSGTPTGPPSIHTQLPAEEGEEGEEWEEGEEGKEGEEEKEGDEGDEGDEGKEEDEAKEGDEGDEEVLEEKEEIEEEEEEEEEEQSLLLQRQQQRPSPKEEKMEDDGEEEEEDPGEEGPSSKEEKMEEEDEEEEDPGEEDEHNKNDGSPEEQASFSRALRMFFKERRMEYKAPKFYGEELNVLKLWRAVTSLGGYEQVTAGKLWRKVGEQFHPPKTCTTLSWSFRGFYEKALLEYERFQAGASYSASSQPSDMMLGTDTQAMSPTTTSSQPSSTPGSGSGRARRDAATRAMHGWHAQRLGNGEVGPNQVIKERIGPSKKEKQLKNLVGSKRKESVPLVERVAKVGHSKGSKGARSLSLDEVPTGKTAMAMPGNSTAMPKKAAKPERTKHVAKGNNMEPMRGLKLVITDDGPPADWVKIKAYMTSEGFEIYALVPGLAREEVRIQCEEGGRVVICGSPEQPINNPWGVTAFRKVVNLPSKIDAHHTTAVVTLYGQLFVRVPYANAFQ